LLSCISPSLRGSLTLFRPPPIRSGPPLRGEDYVRAINEATVNLDVHHPSDVEAAAPNMRVFEVAGSGGLLLSDRLPSIHRYFGPREVDTFRDPREMREKVIQYLDDPELADEMGSRAAARCRSEHTYAHRARALLEMVMGARYRAIRGSLILGSHPARARVLCAARSATGNLLFLLQRGPPGQHPRLLPALRELQLRRALRLLPVRDRR